MIVSPRDGGRLVLVRQVDHQEQCALMADAWGNGDFARPEPFAPLRAATLLHDEGWRAWEEAPGVADGAPVDFPHIDRTTHVALYRAGIARAVEEGVLTGLLVSLHGSGLYEGRGGLDPTPPTPRAERPPAVRDFLAEQDRLQARLRAHATTADGDAGLRAHATTAGSDAGLHAHATTAGPVRAGWEWAAYRLLQTWDAFSLYLTWRSLPAGREGMLPRVPRGAGDDEGVALRLRPAGEDACTCDPWPFAGDRVELPVRAREVPDRHYASAADLAGALAEAPWTTRVCVVSPPGT
ncbi:MAG: DUF3891 family protein [Thermoleophilia bacterium]